MSTAKRCLQSRWATPVVCLVAGLAYLGAGLAGGEPAFAWVGFGIMVVFGAAMLAASRFSETAKGLLDRRDERINALDRDATVIAGVVVILAILVMAIVEIAQGEDGSPYFQLAALAGVSYAVALLWLRWRR
ncbi:hypothetical protein AB3X52_00140 [Nocardioides sp. DS6]|uniref:DUF2178 domain-containing protein n=1 Tax=Nocardioides eburneus TaxID=3231482 RepID=A0ABV3SSU2_9ACTN